MNISERPDNLLAQSDRSRSATTVALRRPLYKGNAAILTIGVLLHGMRGSSEIPLIKGGKKATRRARDAFGGLW